MQFGAEAMHLHIGVDRVSFSFAAGEFVSLVGPSGCGKTTILNLLTGLVADRARGRSFTCSASRRGPAIPTSPTCWRATACCRGARLSATRSYGMEIRGVAKAEREATRAWRCSGVWAWRICQEYPKALSHGMRQRCALARTFALDSRGLLMDEPFGALDAQTKLQLEDVLMDLWSRQPEHRPVRHARSGRGRRPI